MLLGWAGGPTADVSTETELISAVTDSNAHIVRITTNINLSGRIRVGANKSILGASENAGITNGGFAFEDQRNVIMRGLTYSNLENATYSIDIRNSTNMWMNHNNFRGLINVDGESDYLTFSWNVFPYLLEARSIAIAIGRDNAEVNRDRPRVTFHCNNFSNGVYKVPLLRSGMSHMYNNKFENIYESTISSGMTAQCLVERNYFHNANNTVTTIDIVDGFANVRNNIIYNL